MNLPSLPTDNLYKFMAISGIVLFIFSVVFYQTSVRSIETQIITTEQDMSILELQAESLDIDVNALSDEVNTLEETVSKDKATKVDREIKDQIASRLVELNQKNDQQKSKLLEQEINSTKITYQTKLIKLFIDELRGYAVLLAITIPGSLVMKGYGFYCWYTRVQQYEDRKMKKGYAKNN